MKTLIFKIFLFGAIPLLLSGCGNRPKSATQSAETTMNPVMSADSVNSERSITMFNDNDKDFLNEAIKGGSKEVELGPYASEHAVNALQ